MIEFIINHIDFDTPLHQDKIRRSFESTQEAIAWCKKHSSLRDDYEIEAAYKDGEAYNFRNTGDKE